MPGTELHPLHRCGLFALVLTTGLVVPSSSQPPAVGSRTATAPKWLQPPKLTGRCTDDSYKHAETIQLSNAGGRSDAAIRLLHSGLDAYFCASGLPANTASLTIVVNETPRATSAA